MSEGEQAEPQRLGRRLGLEPYYIVAEQAPARLRLQSRPDANRPAGARILAGGALLLAVAAVIAVSGLISAGGGAGFAVAALAAIVAGAIGGLGYQRAIGGYAVLTTSNSLLFDGEARAVTYTQRSRVGGERSQRLPFAQITALRLRRRPLSLGLARAVRPIVALELLAGDQIWVVDSAAEVEALRPVAEAVSAALAMPFQREA